MEQVITLNNTVICLHFWETGRLLRGVMTLDFSPMKFFATPNALAWSQVYFRSKYWWNYRFSFLVPEGSSAEGKHSDSGFARQCASTLDRHSSSGMAGEKKKTRHAGEHVQQTLGMFRYLFRYSKKEEEGRKERKRKKRGRAPELQLTHKQRHSMMLDELLIWYFLCDSHQWSSTDSGELLL